MERAIYWLRLVSFADIADWYALVPGSLARDEVRREDALRELLTSARLGEFGPPDRPSIAYISAVAMHDTWRSRIRLYAHQMTCISPGNVFTTKPLAAKWFAVRQQPPPPWLNGTSPATEIKTIEGELAGPDKAEAPMLAPPASSSKRPGQAAVDSWMLSFYRGAAERGEPPPKREEDAFPQCAKSIGASDRQMRVAMKNVPAEHKRRRGKQDF